MFALDTSKATLSTCLIDPQSKRKLWSREVSNTPHGILALLQHTPEEVPWVIEPTGRYSQTAAKMAREAGRIVLLAPPKQAKAFATSVQQRAKTDPLDAYSLALFALSRPLHTYPIKTEAVEEIDQLLLARKNISKSRQSLRQSAAELSYGRPALEAAAEALTGQIKHLDARIATLVQQGHLEAAVRLQSVPGIGPLVATAVAARLEARQFDRADQFVAYCGLDLAVRESGKMKGKRKITKHGDAELRRLLYLAAQASLRSKDVTLRLQYEREKAKGLSGTQALVALARRIAKLAWSLHRHGTTYDAGRVYSKPSTQVDNQP